MFPQNSYPAPPPPAPEPPSQHWGLALLFSVLSFGIFGWVRLFIQASFAKEIDGGTDAERLAITGIVLQVLVFPVLVIAGLASDADNPSTDLMGVLGILCIFLSFGAFVCFLAGCFSIRESLLGYYNGDGTMRLRVSGPMTFFFHIFYLQHQLRRLAEWERTGAVFA